MNNYEIISTAGEGAFGVVLKCRDRRNNSLVAIKKIRRSDNDPECKEATLLRELRQENIVQLKDCFTRKSILYMVFEFVEQNMLQIIQKSPSGLPSVVTRNYSYQLLKAIDACHSRDIVHQDIKPENVLVTGDNVLKLCDFGYAVRSKSNRSTIESSVYTEFVATRWYRSPEVLLGSRCGKDADVWSAGCIIGEMADGKPVFPGQSELDQLFVIQTVLGPLSATQKRMFHASPHYSQLRLPTVAKAKGLDRRFRHKICAKLLDCMKGMLAIDAANRLDVRQALRHKVFIPEIAMDAKTNNNYQIIQSGRGNVANSTPSLHSQNSITGSRVYPTGNRHSIGLHTTSNSSSPALNHIEEQNGYSSLRRTGDREELTKLHRAISNDHSATGPYRDAHKSRIKCDIGSDETPKNTTANSQPKYSYLPIKCSQAKKSSFIEDAINSFWTSPNAIIAPPAGLEETTPKAELNVEKKDVSAKEAPKQSPSALNDSIPFADDLEASLLSLESRSRFDFPRPKPLMTLDLGTDPNTSFLRPSIFSAPATPAVAQDEFDMGVSDDEFSESPFVKGFSLESSGNLVPLTTQELLPQSIESSVDWSSENKENKREKFRENRFDSIPDCRKTIVPLVGREMLIEDECDGVLDSLDVETVDEEKLTLIETTNNVVESSVDSGYSFKVSREQVKPPVDNHETETETESTEDSSSHHRQLLDTSESVDDDPVSNSSDVAPGQKTDQSGTLKSAAVDSFSSQCDLDFDPLLSEGPFHASAATSAIVSDSQTPNCSSSAAAVTDQRYHSQSDLVDYLPSQKHHVLYSSHLSAKVESSSSVSKLELMSRRASSFIRPFKLTSSQSERSKRANRYSVPPLTSSCSSVDQTSTRHAAAHTCSHPHSPTREASEEKSRLAARQHSGGHLYKQNPNASEAKAISASPARVKLRKSSQASRIRELRHFSSKSLYSETPPSHVQLEAPPAYLPISNVGTDEQNILSNVASHALPICSPVLKTHQDLPMQHLKRTRPANAAVTSSRSFRRPEEKSCGDHKRAPPLAKSEVFEEEINYMDMFRPRSVTSTEKEHSYFTFEQPSTAMLRLPSSPSFPNEENLTEDSNSYQSREDRSATLVKGSTSNVASELNHDSMQNSTSSPLEMLRFLNRGPRKTTSMRRSCSFESISDHKPVPVAPKKTSLGLNLLRQIGLKRIRRSTGASNSPCSPNETDGKAHNLRGPCPPPSGATTLSHLQMNR